jgi:hypothetical protein
VLVDVDVCGGGVDVLLGVDGAPGARWSDLHLAGGRLDADVLIAGLPLWGSCALLAADETRIDPEAVRQVIAVAAELGPVVAALPRGDCPERAAALLACDLVLVLARGDVPGLVAAHAVVGRLPEVPVGVVVRRGTAGVPTADAARLVGGTLLGELPPLGAGFAPSRLPREVRQLAAGIWGGRSRAA